MKDQFSRQKRFSEILDHTFQLLKSNFSTFFLVFLILLGPIYLIEALLLLNSGSSFFREAGAGGSWFDEVMSGFDEGIGMSVGMSNVLSLLIAIFGPLAAASIIFGVDRIRKQESFTAGSLIKQAFSRFLPLVGSTFLMGIIFGVIALIAFIVIVLPASSFVFFEPIMAIIMILAMLFGIFLGLLLLFTRWGFFLAAVAFKEGFPGIPQSWSLTRKNTWRVFGLFLVIFLITMILAAAIDGIFALILGNSVLYMIIVNLVVILVSMINAVAYSVIYFDLKLRQDGDDLKEMIDEYQND
ncbi:hypothetical protein ACDX78_03245 [Virgibacillus oceani]